jgi:hypothetical protein
MTPANDLRTNIGTWGLCACRLPAVAAVMRNLLPSEEFDPSFQGQLLKTTYYDTKDFVLRKARRQGDKYLTLRTRCYKAAGRVEGYALSAKTESQKFRTLLSEDDQGAIEQFPGAIAQWLPGDMLARYQELVGDEPLLAVVTVCCTRYACEDSRNRLTLDVDLKTDLGKCLPCCVLEFKSTDPDTPPPGSLQALGLRPIKLSKFLWATGQDR